MCYLSVASSPPVHSAAHSLQGCQLLLAPDQLLLPGQLLLACTLIWQADSCGGHQPWAELHCKGRLRKLQVPRDWTVNCRQSLAGRGRYCTHKGRDITLAVVSAAGLSSMQFYEVSLNGRWLQDAAECGQQACKSCYAWLVWHSTQQWSCCC